MVCLVCRFVIVCTCLGDGWLCHLKLPVNSILLRYGVGMRVLGEVTLGAVLDEVIELQLLLRVDSI